MTEDRIHQLIAQWRAQAVVVDGNTTCVNHAFYQCADELETLLSERPEAAWTCKARVSTDPPQDCDWPLCGCDPYADKVIAALQESGVLAERPPPQDAPSLVAGVYMDRSIVDFRRSCEVHIAEEQRKPNPDTALIALLCDAVRCSRELTALAERTPLGIEAALLPDPAGTTTP